MSNINNYGVVTGRLLKDVAVFKNEDGSYRSEVNINVDIDGNYADKNKAKQSETVLLEGLIEAGQKDNSVYNKMHKGNIVSIGYTVRNDNYIDKNGNETYRQFLFIEEVDLMEDLNENSEVQSSWFYQSKNSAMYFFA